MITVRVVRGVHNSRDEKGRPVIYKEGDTFQTTEAKLAAFVGKLEAVDKEALRGRKDAESEEKPGKELGKKSGK